MAITGKKATFPIIVFIVAMLLPACESSTSMPTVPFVELQRYQGIWYEIAMQPNRFQSMCVSDTTAQYQPIEDTIKVRNRCRRADGSIEEALGTANVVSDSGNAKLRVSFFWPFYGDYWILALDSDYQWVLVGEPSREYGWILARTPGLPPPTLAKIMARANELGYDKTKFRLTPQTSPPGQ